MLLAWIAASSLLALACNDTDPDVVDTTSGDPTTTSSSSSGNSISASGMADTTAGVDTTAAGSSTAMADGSFLDPSTSEGGPPEQPNGSQCDGADECVSGFCYQIPMFGGVCSECLVDADCATGTCSLDPAGYAVCTDGSIGVMATLGGIIPLGVCGECLDDMDCMGMQTCTPPMASMAGLEGAVCM